MQQAPAPPPNTRYRSYNHLLRIVINICLTTFSMGYSNGYFNAVSFRDISRIYGIEGAHAIAMQGILTGCMSYLGGVGAFWSSYLLGTFSRKHCLQILSSFMILICLLLMIPNLAVLLIARCLQGVCMGMISAVCPVFIREISPTELASSLCPWNQIGIVIGVTSGFLLTFIFSLFMPAQIYWRIVFGFPILPSLIQLYNLKYHYPYETPKWLLLNNKEKEAKQLLAIFYNDQYVEEVYGELKKALNAHKQRDSVNSQTISENDFIDLEPEKRIKKGAEVSQEMQELKKGLLVQKKHIKTSPIAIFAAFHLSAAQQLVGMGPIIAYSGEIVGQILPSAQKIFPIFINLIAISGAFLCIPVLRMFGRKLTLQYGSLTIGLLLLILSLCFSSVNFSQFKSSGLLIKLLICLILLSIRFFFSFTLGPVVWMYISETVQPNIVPYSTMTNWIFVATVNTVFPIAKHKLGGNPAWIFLFFGVYTLFGGLVSKKVLIETQDKNQHEINTEYNEKWKNFKLL